MTTSWAPPWPVSGNVDHVRVSVTNLANAADRGCPEHRALHARPTVKPRPREWAPPRRYAPWTTFLLGGIREAILAVEHRDLAADDGEPWSRVARRAVEYVINASLVRGEVPEAGLRWMRHAVETYLETADDLNRPLSLVAGPRDGWVVSGGRNDVSSEVTAWGLAYMTPDRAYRELRLLRITPLAGREPMAAQAAAGAAFIAATGFRPITGGDWWEPFQRATPPDPEPALVRITEVALVDGSDRLVWEGTPTDAVERWNDIGRPLVPTLVSGGGLVPCRDCAKCRARPICDGLPVAPGLLGLPGYGTHQRILAPTGLDTYRRCPHRYLLTKELNLPRQETPGSQALERGSAVHSWLEQAHRSGVACSSEDLPGPDGDGGNLDASDSTKFGSVALAAGLNDEQYRLAYPFLRQHLAICPLADAAVHEAWPERDLVVFDSDADVLVSWRPDLLAVTDAGPLLRETKTSPLITDATDQDLLWLYPQLALAVCVLADDATGDPRMGLDGAISAIVEVELLGIDAHRLVRFDALDEVTVARARRCLAEAAYRWHGDVEMPARPGVWCGTCEVSRWCPSAQVQAGGIEPGLIPGTARVDGVTVNLATGEVLDSSGRPRTPTASEEAIVASVLPKETDDDEIPF